MGVKDDPSHLLKTTIVGTEIVKGDHVCSYPLRSDATWTVRRRYRDFHRLNGDLEPFGFRLGLPPKKFFGGMSAAFIEQRKAQLQVFLDNISIHPLIFCTASVARFLELSNEPLKEYENHVLVSARNNPKYRLISLLHGCGWRFYKLFAQLNDVTRNNDAEVFIMSWMPFGPDSCVDGTRKSVALLNDCLKFLNGLRWPYFNRTCEAFVDDRGLGTINRRLGQGTLRDRLYDSKPEDSFTRKYSMNRDCFVINKIDSIFIARQLLEVISVLNQLNYPYYNFHCGNIAITDEGCEIMDLCFALAGCSTYNRISLIRSKAQTVEEMRLVCFAQTFFEMLTGTIVFPDHDLSGALEFCPVEIYDVLNGILRPKERMPTVAEIIALP
ncbi:PX domain-containing protein kinase-like protein isoform X2 [Aphelenchoides fujianensis]|nr:PX domain-containing protein kinase-like protein isoform X2 [Aphelenchoides fujianensis]